MTPSPDTDLAKTLATLAHAPDPTAWALVLERMGPAMESLARRLTGDAELARDAVQEALLQIRDGAGSFRAPAEEADRAARSWILRVTANTALVLRRRQTRLRQRERMAPMRNADHSQAVDRDLTASELADHMRSELAALPEPTRAAIVLRHCSGLAFSDVAIALGIPEGTAKVRVHRGLNLLRDRLVRAGFVGSLLAVSGLLQQLSASDIPTSFTSTSAAHQLLTTKATSTVDFIQRGPSMTLHLLASGAAVLLICTISVLLSQAPPTPVAVLPVQPTLSTTAPFPGTEIKPLSFSIDPTALAKLKTATPTASETINGTWKDRFERTERRGFSLMFWTSSQKLLSQHCSVPFGSDWKTTLDVLAKEAGEVWRMRSTSAEFMSPEMAAKLTAPLEGLGAPSGTRTQVLEWFAKHTGLNVTLHRSLGADDGQLYCWSARTATNEAWLDGLAQTFTATAIVAPDSSVFFYRLPTTIPLDNDPEFVVRGPQLVYQAPPAARLDTEVSFDFQDAELTEVRKRIEEALTYPVEIDPQVLTSGPSLVTLRVEKMKLRYVVEFVAKSAGLEVRILPDRLRLSQKESAPTPQSDDVQVIPTAAQ